MQEDMSIALVTGALPICNRPQVLRNHVLPMNRRLLTRLDVRDPDRRSVYRNVREVDDSGAVIPNFDIIGEKPLDVNHLHTRFFKASQESLLAFVVVQL